MVLTSQQCFPSADLPPHSPVKEDQLTPGAAVRITVMAARMLPTNSDWKPLKWDVSESLLSPGAILTATDRHKCCVEIKFGWAPTTTEVSQIKLD